MSAAEEMQLTASRLREKFKVEAGLDDIVQLLSSGSGSGLAAAHAATAKRARALQSAADEMRRLLDLLSDRRAIARFTAEGWDERRAQLAAAFDADPYSGLAEWTGDWCQAAAEARTEALERLVSTDFSFPAGSAPLVERFATATRALSQGRWDLIRPVLGAAAAGLEVGDSQVPSADQRAALLILLARIAVRLGGKPSDELDKARSLGAGPAETAAVDACYERQQGERAAAESSLADARTGGATVSVLPELVIHARDSAGGGLTEARERVNALRTVVDIASQLNRLAQPIPAEVWLAVAERSAKTPDRELAALALRNAELTVGNDNLLAARIHKVRGRMLADADAQPAEVAAEWLAEAGNRLANGREDQLERAAVLYRRVLEQEPDSFEAAASLAAAEAWLCWRKPIGESAGQLASSLERLAVLVADHAANYESAWVLTAMAVIQVELGDGRRPTADQGWRAVLAMARAAIIRPDLADQWVQLDRTLRFVGLYRAGARAGARAYALDPSPQARDDLLITSINLGDDQAMRELLESYGAEHTTFELFARSLSDWVSGRQADAIEGLQSALASSDASVRGPIRHVLAQLYVIAGEGERAAAEAVLLADTAGLRGADALYMQAYSALIRGDLARTTQLARELADQESAGVDRGYGAVLTGFVRLLAGDAGGLADLLAGEKQSRMPRLAQDWQHVDRPFLEALAAQRGVSLPDLTPVTQAVRDRQAELDSWADPLTELVSMPAPGADAAVLAQARAVLAVVLAEAAGDLRAARGSLLAGADVASGLPEWPVLADRVLGRLVDALLASGDLDEALAAETDRLTAGTDPDTPGRLPDIAVALAAAGRSDQARHVIATARARAGESARLDLAAGDVHWRDGDCGEAGKAWESARTAGEPRAGVRLAAACARSDQRSAVELLRSSIARSYLETVTDLSQLPLEPPDRGALAAALRQLMTDPGLAPAAVLAINVVESESGELELPGSAIELNLPPAWFTGMADPVTESPVIARYIPEARLRLGWTMPGVRTRSEAGLDANAYQILVLGMLVEQGTMPPEAEFVAAESVPLLSAAARGRVTDSRAGDLAELRAGDGPRSDGMDALLIVPAAEMIGRRIQAVAAAHQLLLEQFWRHEAGLDPG